MKYAFLLLISGCSTVVPTYYTPNDNIENDVPSIEVYEVEGCDSVSRRIELLFFEDDILFNFFDSGMQSKISGRAVPVPGPSGSLLLTYGDGGPNGLYEAGEGLFLFSPGPPGAEITWESYEPSCG